MLTYELCKKLKDAGFPLQDSYAADLDMWSEKFSIEIDGIIYLTPTLSELIEACGDKFRSLMRSPFGRGYEVMDFEVHLTKGDNPEEAVAHLYIILNSESNVQGSI